MTAAPTTAAPSATATATIGATLRQQVATRGEATWVVCDDDRLTYAQADQRSRALARGLVAIGASRGTRVGILYPTGTAYIVAWLAAARIGAVAVPISTFSTADELRGLLAKADVGVLLSIDTYRGHDYVERLERGVDLDWLQPNPLFSSAAPSLRFAYIDGNVAEADATRVHPAHSIAALLAAGNAIDDAHLDAVEADVSPADRMVIVHTSGSTSEPKGVIHTHGSLIRHLTNLNQLRGLDTGVKLFSNSPMFWIGGLAYNLVGTLVAGATLICSTTLDGGEALDLIERERPDLVNGFVQSIGNLVAHPSFAQRDFSSIRSGNLYPLLPDHIRPVDTELRHNMLGMTETGSVCLMSADERDQPEKYRGSFGRPVPELEARVVDAETFADCSVNEQGELWLRGPLLMEGYDGRERHETFTPDGWYRTGDQFSIDEDGFFYFYGRRGDMIKTGGANVSPREVEAVVRDMTGAIMVIVFGLADAERGQIVAAVVVAPEEVAIDLKGLPTRLREKLSAYKVPRKLVRMSPAEVPMLSSGKPDMPRLTELVRAR